MRKFARLELYSFLVKNKATMKDHTFVPTSETDEAAWPRLPVVAGVPVARTDVTSFISKYIKDHNLQNPEMKREIIPDAALKKVFANLLHLLIATFNCKSTFLITSPRKTKLHPFLKRASPKTGSRLCNLKNVFKKF